MNLPNFVLPIEPHISEVCFGDRGWEAKGGQRNVLFFPLPRFYHGYHRLPCQIVAIKHSIIIILLLS